jgi:hypothetical protein
VTVSHDDTVALQAAFNVGGDVRVPAGDYSISSSITITNTVNIYGAIGKTIIDNAGTGAAFIIALGSGCTIDGLTIRGTSISGSGILLNTSCKLSNLVITGNGRYGIEFSDTANVISQHTNKCTISYNILGGVYSKSTAAYQKNAVTFLQCYVVANGDQTQTGATSSTGHGYFVQGGIDWTIIGGVSETNIGAGIFIQSTSSYSVYGFNVQGEHLESNRYANILVDVTNGTMTDVHIEGNYYFNATNYSGSLITTTSCRTIVLNYASMTYSNIDLTYGNNTIKTLFMQQKQSLKLGGEIESISPYLPYTKHAVSGDPLASSYNILRLDSTLGPGYTESTDLSTFVDPRDSYRIIFEYRYNKSSSTSATLSFLQLDGTKSNIGSPISTGLASGDTWFTQELLVNSQFLTLTRYLQISATINGTVGASDYLLIRKIMIYRLNGAVAPSGPTTSRPTFVVVGYMYFDTTLNKPIWCKVNGSPGTWVDATGTTV